MHYFAVSKMSKKNCVLCRNFISIYKINRTLHGRLGIRILSSCAERYVQYSKINFVSLRSHVISSIWFSRGNSYRSTKRVQTYSKRPRSHWPAHSKASWVKGWEIKQTFSIITCICVTRLLQQFLSNPFTCSIRMHNLLFCTQVSNLLSFKLWWGEYLTVKAFFTWLCFGFYVSSLCQI